jgi:hypothetical protein
MDTQDKINYTLKFGTYYNPASRHYGSNASNVICDNCRKENLKACIGWENCDLCMQCIDRLNDKLYVPIPRVNMPPVVMCMFPTSFSLNSNNKNCQMESNMNVPTDF